ncbi:hypothetical protein [Nitrosopumilus sp. S4]
MSSDAKKIKELESRISKLEKAVFPSNVSKKTNSKTYKGLTGGLSLLLDNNFFKKPKLVTEVQDELKKEGYYYSLQSTDTLLRRDMVNRKKILTRLKSGGVWQYVIRK